jgi:hypothetical protein
MDRSELRRLAEAAINHPTINVPLDCGTADIPSLAMEAYQEEVSNPAAIIELLDEIEALKCCGNCKHQTYDGMDYGCELVLKNYHQNKCDKWQGVK